MDLSDISATVHDAVPKTIWNFIALKSQHILVAVLLSLFAEYG
jgi:hypothetical protein